MNKSEYNKKYDKEHYKMIGYKASKEDAEKIEEFCSQMNMTKSEFLKKCVEYGLTHDIF